MFSEAIKNCQTGSMIIKKQTTDVRILKTGEILITISKYWRVEKVLKTESVNYEYISVVPRRFYLNLLMLTSTVYLSETGGSPPCL